MSTFDITRIGPIAHDKGELNPAVDFTIIGPCPGCWLWTIEYPAEIALQYLPQEWNDEIEDRLREHLAECSGLREIVESQE